MVSCLMWMLASLEGQDAAQEWKILAASNKNNSHLFALVDIDVRNFQRGTVARSPVELALAVGTKDPKDALAKMAKIFKVDAIDFDKQMVILLQVHSKLQNANFERKPLMVKGKTLVVGWQVSSNTGKEDRNSTYHFREALLVEKFDGEVVFDPKVRDPLVEREKRKKYDLENPYQIRIARDNPLVPLRMDSEHKPGPPAAITGVYRSLEDLKPLFGPKGNLTLSNKLRNDFSVTGTLGKYMLVDMHVGYRRSGTKIKATGLKEKDGKLILSWIEEPPGEDKTFTPFYPCGASFLVNRYDGPVEFDPPVTFQKVRGDDLYHADGKLRDQDEGLIEVYPPKGSDLKVFGHFSSGPHGKVTGPGATVAYYTAGMDRWHNEFNSQTWLDRHLLPKLKVREVDWKTQMLVYVTPEGLRGPGRPFQIESIKKTDDQVVIQGRYDGAAPAPEKFTPAAGEWILLEKAKGKVVLEVTEGKLLPIEKKKGNHPDFAGSDVVVYAARRWNWDPQRPKPIERVVREEAETHGFIILNPRPTMEDEAMQKLLGISRIVDFHTQMLIHFTPGAVPHEGYKFRVKSLKVVNKELVVTGELKHFVGYRYKNPNERGAHPGEMLLVERFDGPVKFVVEHIDKLEYPPNTKIQTVKILASAPRLEFTHLKNKVEPFETVVRSKEELAKALLMNDADQAMNRAAKELKVDAIDFEKQQILVLGLGTHTGKTEGNVRGGQVFKNKHYWEEADWKQLTAVNGMLNVFAHSFSTGRNDFNRLYVSLTLIERWDGQVRFIHQHRPEEVFKGGDPLEK